MAALGLAVAAAEVVVRLNGGSSEEKAVEAAKRGAGTKVGVKIAANEVKIVVQAAALVFPRKTRARSVGLPRRAMRGVAIKAIEGTKGSELRCPRARGKRTHRR